MIFDGRAFAREIEEQVKNEVAKLPKKPVVMSILVGDDPASELYTSLKKKAAERVGIEYRVANIAQADEIEALIREAKNKVDGIMIQLPIPGLSREAQNEMVKLIPLEKDVDGLRWEESNVMPATVKAIILILEKIAENDKDIWNKKFVVVGGTGAVGRPLVHYLKIIYEVEAEIANSKTTNLSELVKSAQVVISCVGRVGLIKSDMVDDTKIVIDVGISANLPAQAGRQISESANQPKVVGDMEREVYEIAKMAVPVPGGVGPVTVASLMKNALDMVRNQTIGKLGKSEWSE